MHCAKEVAILFSCNFKFISLSMSEIIDLLCSCIRVIKQHQINCLYFTNNGSYINKQKGYVKVTFYVINTADVTWLVIID